VLDFDKEKAPESKAYYSMGPSIFSPQLEKSGPQGDFVAANLTPGLQFLMPTQLNQKEWPAAIINTLGTPSEFSMNINIASSYKYNFTVSDAILASPPLNGPMLAILYGQNVKGTSSPQGEITLDSIYKRASVDIIEIKERALGEQERLQTDPSNRYIKTWLNISHTPGSLLKDVSVYTKKQISVLLGQQTKLEESGLVFGSIDKKIVGRHKIKIEIVDSFGIIKKNKIVYFDDSFVDQSQSLKFAIPSLEAGEWHLVVRDANDKNALLAVQVVRTNVGVISQVGF
jgi:hypothetical protein